METQPPGDLGYNGFPVSLFYLAEVELDAIEDHIVAIVLRNMLKKNAVTKEKGVAEFLRLLKENAFDVSNYSILICWLQLFPRLCIDASKTVRILAIQTQALYMEKYGAKEFSKYLKSSLPSWLGGLFDERSIAIVTRNGLLSNFANDNERVDVKVWAVFLDQIIHYCHAALVYETPASIVDQRYETPEELMLKCNRVVCSAVLMLTYTIRLSNGGLLGISENSLQELQVILTSKQVWNLLGLSLKKDSMSMPLLKALLGLIIEIFGPNCTIMDRLDDIKVVYKVVSKYFVKFVKLESATNSRVIYSSILLPLLDSLERLTLFPVLERQKKLKKNFWVLGGSKSFSRLRDYLLLGPCNSDAVYYDKLIKLFISMRDADISSEDEFLFLNFGNPDHAEAIIRKILLPQLDQFRSFDSWKYRAQFIYCITQVVLLFTCDLEPLIQSVFTDILDAISSARANQRDKELKKECVNSLRAFTVHCNVDTRTMEKILISALGSTDSVVIDERRLSSSPVDLCITLYDVLNDKSGFLKQILEKTDGSYNESELVTCLTIVLHILKASDGIAFTEWAPALPSLVTPLFVELPLQVFEALIPLELDLDYQEILGDFFTKIVDEAPAYLKQLLSLPVLGLSEKFSSRNPEAYAFLLQLSQQKNRLADEDEIVFAYLDDPEIRANLLNSVASESGSHKLLQYLIKRGTPLGAGEWNCDSISLLLSKAIDTIDQPSSRDFLSLFGQIEVVQDVIQKKVMAQRNVQALCDFLSDNENYVPFKAFEREIAAAVAAIDLRSLALANSLEHGVALIDEPKSFQLSTSVTSFGAFIAALTERNPLPGLLLLAALYSEYLLDYEFLASAELVENISDIAARLHQSVWKNALCNPESVVALLNGVSINSILDPFNKSIAGTGPFNGMQFYHARIISRAFSLSLANLAQHDFDALDINYTSLAKHPLKLAALLSAADGLAASLPGTDRLKTYVFSEILDVNSSEQILSVGIQFVTLATYFLKADDGTFVGGPKMAMVLNQLGDWLECDVAFEACFVPVRCLLGVFFCVLLQNHGARVPEKAWKIAADLCVNNLATAQVERDCLSLRYTTMKLFMAFSRKDSTNGYIEESRAAIFAELLSIVTDKAIEEESLAANNGPMSLTDELTERIFNRLTAPKTVVEPKINQLYETLRESGSVVSQRISVLLLQPCILEVQQEFVVEYQLQRTKLGEEAEEVPVPQLPGHLIDNISVLNNRTHMEDLLDAGAYPQAMRYVWSWILIFAHFQDTTFNIKLDYISQIKAAGNLDFLFDTIFDTIWPGDPSFLNKLVIEPLERGSKATLENSLLQNYCVSNGFGDALKDEVHLALVYLYYLSFQYLAPYVQQWHNNIRDLQQKQLVGKFSATYVSPLLISKMLDDVERAKQKLTSMDENLTVRVNRVTNEIKSVYVIDEQTMEMVVKIPPNYPLSSVSVEGPLRLGVKESQWKAWLLASQRVISLTNGSIVDSIELFNRNVNLHFLGFVECAICYSILHQDHSLPSKTCPTCLNKFHSACLYKWFKSSGSSTCPLCRCAFNFKQRT